MKRLLLLQEPLIRVAVADGSSLRLSLPEVFVRLSTGEDLVFLALRPHQQPAWHAFLVQLAFLGLERVGRSDPPVDAAAWREVLTSLTTAWPGDEPWCLVVDAFDAPAFLQPPGAAADYRGESNSAQELDVLVTSKNHDEKSGKLDAVVPDEADVWIYALVSLQGFAGYLGRGNFSTMRMNGGFASRPQFRLVFDEGTGAEFVRDLKALLGAVDEQREDAEVIGIGTDGDPLRLLWLEPWSERPLPLSRVHPLCLEVTRRVRLVDAGQGRLRLATAPSLTMRVAAKDNKGLVLDPWIPIVVDGEPRALTAQSDSFSYHRLAPLLFDAQRCKLPLLARPTQEEVDSGQPAVLRAQVLVGGSGRTDGCLRREVPMAPDVVRRYATQRTELARRARAFIELASLAQGKVLRAALLQFVDGTADVDWKSADFGRLVAPSVAALERRIDDVFFDDLFATETNPPMSDEEARRHWAGRLRELTRSVFDPAVRSLPTRNRSRELARARAERWLGNAMRAHLSDEMPSEEEPTARTARPRKRTPNARSAKSN